MGRTLERIKMAILVNKKYNNKNTLTNENTLINKKEKEYV